MILTRIATGYIGLKGREPGVRRRARDGVCLSRAVQIAALAGGARVIIAREELAIKATRQFPQTARNGVENRMMFDAMMRCRVDDDAMDGR